METLNYRGKSLLNHNENNCTIQLTEIQNRWLLSFLTPDCTQILMPHLIRTILTDIDYQTVCYVLSLLNIRCCQCSEYQLTLLHARQIIPIDVDTCGLIDKQDAKKLVRFITEKPQLMKTLTNTPSLFALPIMHHCFGEQKGIFYTAIYQQASSKCIKCLTCSSAFSTRQFVTHNHTKLNDVNSYDTNHRNDRNTIHWGFSSFNWRYFIHIDTLYDNLTDFDHIFQDMIKLFEQIKLLYYKDEINKHKSVKFLWRPRNFGVSIPKYTLNVNSSKITSNFLTNSEHFYFKNPDHSSLNKRYPNVYIKQNNNSNNCDTKDNNNQTNTDTYSNISSPCSNLDIANNSDLSSSSLELTNLSSSSPPPSSVIKYHYQNQQIVSNDQLKIIQKLKHYKTLVYQNCHRNSNSKNTFTSKSSKIFKFYKKHHHKLQRILSRNHLVIKQCQNKEDLISSEEYKLHESVFQKLSYLLQYSQQRRLKYRQM